MNVIPLICGPDIILEPFGINFVAENKKQPLSSEKRITIAKK
jgi:hypothetical protein